MIVLCLLTIFSIMPFILEDGKDSSIMCRHNKNKGNVRNTKFDMKIVSKHKTAMDRQHPREPTRQQQAGFWPQNLAVHNYGGLTTLKLAQVRQA